MASQKYARLLLKLPKELFRARLNSLHCQLGKFLPHLDWRVLATCRVASLLFTANRLLETPLAVHEFYCLSVDSLICELSDFERWQRHIPASVSCMISFCHYPFLLSLGKKMAIMDYDVAQRASGNSFPFRICRDSVIRDSFHILAQLHHFQVPSITFFRMPVDLFSHFFTRLSPNILDYHSHF